MSVLSVQSVSYSYKTKYQTVQAVKDVSCDLSAGTFYALVGKSGSGKTTLLSLLAGLDTPQSGDIIVGGQSLRDRRPRGGCPIKCLAAKRIISSVGF